MRRKKQGAKIAKIIWTFDTKNDVVCVTNGDI